MINFIKKLKTLNEMKKFFKEKAAQGEPLSAMDDMVFKIMLFLKDFSFNHGVHGVSRRCNYEI